MNTTIGRRADVEQKLNKLASEISVPENKYKDAKERYEAVGDWLADENSSLNQYEPRIYSQGSFAFGTAIKPLEGCDYDIDAVCLLQTTTSELTQEQLKKLVGDCLKEHEAYSQMLDPKEGGRRCWTLKYADNSKFHMDILPAIPDNTINFNSLTYKNEISKHAINITDKEHENYEIFSNDWLKSNPQGLVNWFHSEMRRKEVKTVTRDFAANESVEELPAHTRGRVLQKAIQLLKYHRDMNWGGDDDKPISIIITTLATKAYNGEDNLYDTLPNICKTMSNYVENHDGVHWVENPVNSEENFADKWEETPKKAQVFFQWLNSLNKLFTDLLDEKINFAEALDSAYRIKRQSNSVNYPTTSKSKYMSNPIFDVPYREKPLWLVKSEFEVKINATFQKEHSCKTHNYYSNGEKLPKEGTLQFNLNTNVPKPYETKLQVVNTGTEASTKNDLRGKFFDSFYIDSDTHRETTRYSGKHMIQASIIKNGVCVGRSEEFVVNIM